MISQLGDNPTLPNFLIATGSVLFNQAAETPAQAIELLKARIRRRISEDASGAKNSDPKIGSSLAVALEECRLNFLVMDNEREKVFAGECQGIYQEPVSRELALQFDHLLHLEQLRSFRLQFQYA